MPKGHDQPLVSVITPVFNGERFLLETLEAVEKQTLSRVEHIVVNDGSTDNTSEILRRWALAPGRARGYFKVIQQENAGESAAVNAGVKASTGKYILVLSADDLLLPQALEVLSSVLESTDALVAYPDWLLIDGASCVKQTVKTLDYYPELVSLDLHCAPGPGALIRRDCIVGNLRDESYRLIPDLEQWIRLSKLGNFRRVPFPLAAWRQHESGTTFLTRGRRTADEFRRLVSDILTRDKLTPPQIRRLEGALHYVVCLQGLFDKSIRANSSALKALVLNPQRFRKSHGGHWLIGISAVTMPFAVVFARVFSNLGFSLPPLARDLALSSQSKASQN